MNRNLVVAFSTAICLVAPLASQAEEDPAAALQGAWNAQSMEADGQPVPQEAVNRIRFEFQGKKLLFKGNFSDDRVMECEYKVDATKKPHYLEFTPNDKEKKTVAGIYEVQGDDLKVCMRHAESKEGRPTEFATKPESQLILIVFKKEKK